MLSERRHHRSLFEYESLAQLPAVDRVEGLGLSAVARIRLFSPDAPFAAYLAGYDHDDTCYGLVVANQLRLGHIYLSGLEVAQQVWDIGIEPDHGWMPVILWEVVKGYAIGLSTLTKPAFATTMTERLRTIQAQLAASKSQEKHDPR